MGLWFWIGVAFVSWGLASFFGKMVAPYFAPTYLLWIRSIITIVLLLPIVWAQRALTRSRLRRPGRLGYL